MDRPASGICDIGQREGPDAGSPGPACHLCQIGVGRAALVRRRLGSYSLVAFAEFVDHDREVLRERGGARPARPAAGGGEHDPRAGGAPRVRGPLGPDLQARLDGADCLRPAVRLAASATVGGRALTARATVVSDAAATAGLEAADGVTLGGLARRALVLGAVAVVPGRAAVVLAADARPAGLTIPLAATVDGAEAPAEVTVAWPDLSLLPPGWTAVLRDAATGETVDLRERASYTLTTTGAAGLARPAPVDSVGPPSPRPLRLASGLDAARGVDAGRLTLVLSPPAVAAEAEAAVTELAVERVAPNPFRDRLAVRFALPEAGAVRVSLVDVLGRTVAVLVDGDRAAGRHEATAETRALAAGVYVVRVEAGGRTVVRRVTVVR